MRPTAIVLNYSIENMQNDVRHKLIIYEKFQFDSLVWGSLTLAIIPNSIHKALGISYSSTQYTQLDRQHILLMQ